MSLLEEVMNLLQEKLTHAVARIKYGLQKELRLGNLKCYSEIGDTLKITLRQCG